MFKTALLSLEALHAFSLGVASNPASMDLRAASSYKSACEDLGGQYDDSGWGECIMAPDDCDALSEDPAKAADYCMWSDCTADSDCFGDIKCNQDIKKCANVFCARQSSGSNKGQDEVECG